MRKHSRVVLVGLGFGVEFIPIYQQHPAVDLHGICRRDKSELKVIGDHFNIKNRYDDYQEVLKDPLVDFVHINSPIGDHGWMSIEALKSGKHVICTVPMATVIAECEEIVALVKATGLKYMMAETVVYSREFLFIKEMYECGDLGDIQFMKASHLQDMEGWPDYWKKMIPMHYATHVVSPVLGLVNGCAEYVSCFGSGSVNEEIRQLSGNPFAVESCHIKIKDMDLSAQVWRFLYDTARQYTESFDVYGTKQSFEWGLVDGDEPFDNLLCQGMVLKDGAKMSKSKGNTVDPQGLIEKYGADTVRLFVMFAAPPEQSLEWSDQGVQGAHRFINRIWRLVNKHIDSGVPENKEIMSSDEKIKKVRSKTHKTLAKVKDDYMRRHSFNTAIASVMELSNEIPKEFLEVQADQEMRATAHEAIESILLMLAPITPHLCQHLWWQLHPSESIVDKKWPEAEKILLEDDTLNIAIQINGKLRSEIEINKNTSEEEVKSTALLDDKIKKYLEDKEVRKIIYVPGKILNIVL